MNKVIILICFGLTILAVIFCLKAIMLRNRIVYYSDMSFIYAILEDAIQQHYVEYANYPESLGCIENSILKTFNLNQLDENPKLKSRLTMFLYFKENGKCVLALETEIGNTGGFKTFFYDGEMKKVTLEKQTEN